MGLETHFVIPVFHIWRAAGNSPPTSGQAGGGRLLGWRIREADGEAPPLCRPDGPGGELVLCVDKDGKRLEGLELEFPPFLDEKELDVQPRRRLLGNLEGQASQDDLDINTFSEGRVPKVDLGLDP